MKDGPEVTKEGEDESKNIVEEKQEQQFVAPVAEEKPRVSEKVVMEVEEKKVEPEPTTETKVFLRLYNPITSEVIDGEVEIIDAERATLLKKEKSNQMVSIPNPRTKSGKVTLVGSSFGYRKVQHDLSLQSLKDSPPDYVEWDKDHYVINFDLSRLHKGDIEIMYNVYFFNDATVMLPESKYELDKLLDMLKSNSGYRVKLHGHTNGNGQGKIIYMGPDKNFFELTPDVTTGFGSAKELSHQRAITIKEWLIANKISADRIETKGWGGSRMLHHSKSEKARRNVRVEVEVLSE
jgi:outer membrane protein OmpA-like peptidoglycan-associated protein